MLSSPHTNSKTYSTLLDQITQHQRKDFIANMHQGMVTLVANNRLIHSLRYDIGVFSSKNTWINPEIYTLDQWLEKMLKQACFWGLLDCKQIPLRILNPLEQQIIFTGIIKDWAKNTNPLLGFSELAREAVDAWSLLRLYRVHDINQEGLFLSRELKNFNLWLAQYKKKCQAEHMGDFIDILSLFINNFEKIKPILPSSIQIVGFDIIVPPLVYDLFANFKLNTLALEEKATSIAKIACDNYQDEVRQAALWTQQILGTDPKARIGVIVPQLEQRRDQVKTIFKEILYPEQSTLDFPEYKPIHNISLGKPLIDFELIGTALGWLDVLTITDPIDYTQISTLLRSPHWSAGSNGIVERTEFDLVFRSLSNKKHDFRDLFKIMNQHFKIKPAWALVLENVYNKFYKNKLREYRHIGDHVEIFAATLNALRLVHGQNNTINIQLTKGLKKSLNQLRVLGDLVNRIDIRQAFILFKQICSQHIFQFRSSISAPIQIMGVLESTAQKFDYLWVMQADINSLPMVAVPNAILPLDLQVKTDMPRSSADHERRYAKKLVDNLCRTSSELIFSYARVNEDGLELAPSSLIAQFEEKPQASSANNYPSNFRGQVTLERIIDDKGTPLSCPHRISNATAFFKAQAICPLMAYAEFRLGLNKLAKPDDILSPINRGILVHRVFERLLAQHNMSKITFKGIKQICQKEVNNFFKPHGVSSKILELENMRVQNIAFNWFEKYEFKRQEYSVYALEHKISTDISGFEFDLRIDRIDQINDKYFIIDYKTGPASATWENNRLTEPQMPIYAISFENTCGIGLAKISPRETRLSYWCHEILLNENNAKKTELEWQDHLQNWQRQLEILAEEIKSGDARLFLNDIKSLEKSPAFGLLRIYKYE